MQAAFIEGDSLHPPQNIDKMKNDIPLTDEDRKGWLEQSDVINALNLKSLLKELRRN